MSDSSNFNKDPIDIYNLVTSKLINDTVDGDNTNKRKIGESEISKINSVYDKEIKSALEKIKEINSSVKKAIGGDGLNSEGKTENVDSFIDKYKIALEDFINRANVSMSIRMMGGINSKTQKSNIDLNKYFNETGATVDNTPISFISVDSMEYISELSPNIESKLTFMKNEYKNKTICLDILSNEEFIVVYNNTLSKFIKTAKVTDVIGKS